MDLIEWKEKVSLCVKCGSCLSVCPVYLETSQETLVARGKMALLSGHLSDDLPADKRLYDLLSNCLLCGACSENCPSGVQADDLIQQGRSLLLEKVGAARWKKLLAKGILPFPNRLKTIRGGQSLLFKKIPGESGLNLRFSSDPRTWPALAQPFFLDQKDFKINQTPTPSFKIGFFVGCTTNYIYPEIGEAALKLIGPLGEVILPDKQSCCGLPAFSLGDIKTARELARKNVLAFTENQTDTIVVACSSCAAHIKLEYPRLLEDDAALFTKVRDFIHKVEELSRFLTKRDLNFTSALHHNGFSTLSPLTVAFHDPCHAKRKLNISNEPRKLLNSIPGLSLVELKEHRCCGHGGLFNLSHPDLSQKILEHPLTDLDLSEAEVIATSCMACLMQFKLGVQRTGRKIQVKHWAELMV
jgi:glycolate oxidase iron-sulfur subunit